MKRATSVLLVVTVSFVGLASAMVKEMVALGTGNLLVLLVSVAFSVSAVFVVVMGGWESVSVAPLSWIYDTVDVADCTVGLDAAACTESTVELLFV